MEDTNINDDQSKTEISDFLGYLNSEIDYLNKDMQEPRWSRWAIIVAIASCCWIGLQYINNGLKPFTIIILIILFSSFTDSIWSIRYLIKRRYEYDDKPKFQFAFRHFSAKRMSIFLISFRYAVISLLVLIVTFWSPLIEWRFASYLSWIWNVAQMIWFAVLILWSGTDSPVHTKSRSKEWRYDPYSYLTSFLLNPSSVIAVSIIIIIYCLKNLILIQPNIDDLRVFGVILTVSILCYLLSTANRSKPLVDTLLSIRRELMFDRIDLFTAKKQCEIAIIGLDLSTFFQEDIDQLITISNKENTDLVSGLNIMKKITTLIKAIDVQNLTLDDKNKIRGMVMDSVNHLKSYKDSHLKYVLARKDFLFYKINKVKRQFKFRNFETFNELEKRVDSFIGPVITSYENVIEELSNQLSSLNQNNDDQLLKLLSLT